MKCPTCGAPFLGFSPLYLADPKDEPEEGDAAVCDRCGALNVWETGGPRSMSDDEITKRLTPGALQAVHVAREYFRMTGYPRR